MREMRIIMEEKMRRGVMRWGLEKALIGFFLLCALSLVVVYIVEPAIYAEMLKLTSSPKEPYPLLLTLFLAGVLVLVGVVIVGVVRHWYWLFWLLLVAFGSSVIAVVVDILQLSGVFPGSAPVWYGLYRLGIAMIEVVFAVWMVRVYRRDGVWAMGKKKPFTAALFLERAR
ncbi:MAG: hypothetical protein J2P37_34745 [Ktedonobacteraceae bacterium]|nr:hypothetical protein [Ktedonobacteraceae bacterium]